MEHWFKCANPSTELYSAIDQVGIHAAPSVLKLIYPVFLEAIQHSVTSFPCLLFYILHYKLSHTQSFPNTQKRDLYHQNLNAYQTQLKRILSEYLSEDRLVFLLLSTLHRLGSSETMIDLFINKICSLPPAAVLMDSDQGFYLMGDKPISERWARFPQFSKVIIDLLTKMPDCGDLYAKAALFLVSSLSRRLR